MLDVYPPQEGLILDKINKRKITPSISSPPEADKYPVTSISFYQALTVAPRKL